MTAAERLSTRLEELASALHRAGAPGAAAARLLELSALATLKAVELDLRASAANAAALPLDAHAELAVPLHRAA